MMTEGLEQNYRPATLFSFFSQVLQLLIRIHISSIRNVTARRSTATSCNATWLRRSIQRQSSDEKECHVEPASESEADEMQRNSIGDVAWLTPHVYNAPVHYA